MLHCYQHKRPTSFDKDTDLSQSVLGGWGWNIPREAGLDLGFKNDKKIINPQFLTALH